MPSAGESAYWSLDPDALFQHLASSPDGLSSDEAARRLAASGAPEFQSLRPPSLSRVVLRQVASPLLWLLAFAAIVAAITGEWSSAVIVLVIALATVGIGATREYQAQTAAAALNARVRVMARVVRDGAPTAVPRVAVVPGDVFLLSAGSLIPADGVILDATAFFVTEAVLTGESFPVEKRPGPTPAAAPLPARLNAVFLGTSVRSGSARCVAVRTGVATEFGAIARRLARRAPETDFDRGIRHFGYLLTSAMLVIVILVFAAHMLRHRPPIETLLFSVALAVGLSPELLPAILGVNLARGAQMMAKHGVLVRRLNAIENLGSMTVLCTDKTGTLTEGVVRLTTSCDPDGAACPSVFDLALINARLGTGFTNPLDEAVIQAAQDAAPAGAAAPLPRKLGEIPFDFLRKRVSIVVERPDGAELIMKGACQPVLETCVLEATGAPLDAAARDRIDARHRAWSAAGVRVVAVASRAIERRPAYTRDDETGLTLRGFLTFLDQPKEGVHAALADLKRLGVTVKMISGDNALVAAHVAALVGLEPGGVVTGGELQEMTDSALLAVVGRSSVFAEVDPNQKERLIRAIARSGQVVGFLGDGVNDAPAMHAADTSLSVDQAVDVAREAADFVLLERDLDVIRAGIEEGRRTFANTLKYILTTTSANLGNMISMAGASLFLPFLPLTAGQILLNNLLSDVPAVGIADDSVDPEMVARPPRWDLRFIGRFMLTFGVLSSVFDVLTFVVLLQWFKATVPVFQTGWFVESLLTELAVALVIRTRRPAYQSRPGRLLVVSTVVVAILGLAVPYLPFVDLMGFVPLPLPLLVALIAVTIAYVAVTELAKRWFYGAGAGHWALGTG